MTGLARRRAAAAIIAFSLALPTVHAAELGPLPGADVDSLLAYARQHNPEFAAMRYEADAAGARIESAQALPDPMLLTELRDVTNDASGGGPNLNPSRIGSARYQLSQSLPGWGKRDLKRGVAEASADEARFRAQAAWNELAAQIKSAYSEYWRNSKSIELTREVHALVRDLERIARQRYASGLAPQQDVIRAQVEATNHDSDIAMLEAERASLAALLNSLLPRPGSAPLAEPQALRPLPKLEAAALQSRLDERSPRLQAEAARRKSAEQNRDLTYRNRSPDWRVGVGAVQMGSRVAEWELMLEVNLPLQQGSRRAQEREAEALFAASTARRDSTAAQLAGELGRAIAGLEGAQKLEQLSTQNLLPQTQLNLQSALIGYENGKVDFATLLDAQRQIRQARLMQIRAQADARMRLAEIERIVGEE
jgi:outer membrane protein, heavy metal efflux system